MFTTCHFHLTLRSNDAVSDKILFNISKSISDEMTVTHLGLALGATLPDIKRHLTANRMDGHMTYKGTLDILCDWKGRTRRNDQESELRTALVESELAELADIVFRKGWLNGIP